MNENNQPLRTKVLDFFQGTVGTQFVIPVYQRNYTWKYNDQVKKFLNDIFNIDENMKSYFIGIIMYLSRELNFKQKEYTIIDGQQRLTTMFLILYVIKELADENNQKEVSDFIDVNIYNTNVDSNFKMKLKPLVSDDDVYRKISNGLHSEITKEDKETLIYKSYLYIKEYISSKMRDMSLSDILDKKLRKLQIVAVPLIESDNAQQIFESINASGEPLTAIDLIRNYILMDLDSAKQDDIYNKYWKKLEGLFPEQKKMENFIRNYIASKRFYLPNINDVYNEFKKLWEDDWNSMYLSTNPFSRMPNEIEDNVDFNDIVIKLKILIKSAENYNYIYYTDAKIEDEIYDYRRYDSTTPLPFILGVFELYDSNKIEKDELLKIVDLINNYMIRRELAGFEQNTISRMFPTLLKNIIEAQSDDNLYYKTLIYLVNYNKNNVSKLPEDALIENHLKGCNAYKLPSIRIVLDKLENYNNTAPVNLDDLNIEHIMPQTITEYWKKVIGDQIENYELYVNLIGNITLVSISDNSSFQNGDFNYKKSVMNGTKHIKLNEDITNKDKWTIQEINERTKDIIEKICKVYPYTLGQVKKDSKYRISLERKDYSAYGYFNTNGKIEIDADSQLRYKKNSIFMNNKIVHYLFDEGIVIEEENTGKLIFAKNYTFDNIDDATEVITGTNEGAKNIWKDNNNMSLKDGLANLIISSNKLQ